MATVHFPYKPELSEKKAKCFSRCFIHCLNDETMELSNEEKEWLTYFILKVDEKDYISRMMGLSIGETGETSDYEEEEEELSTKSAATVEDEMAHWPIESLEHFVLVYGEDESKAFEVELAQRLIIRKREQNIQRIRPPENAD